MDQTIHHAYTYANTYMEGESRMKEDWVYRRGDIYFANLGFLPGSKQGGKRPVIVVQNDVGNRYSPTVTLVPLTTRIDKKKNMPTHYFIRKAKGLKKPSMALAEQVGTYSKECIISYLGRLSKGQMRGIDEALRAQVGFYIDEYSGRTDRRLPDYTTDK